MSGRHETDRLVERVNDLDRETVVVQEGNRWIFYQTDDFPIDLGDETSFRTWALKRLGL